MNICKCGIAAVDCDYHRPTDKFTERAKKVAMLLDPEAAKILDAGPLNWPRPMTIDDLIKAEQELRVAKIPEFDPGPPSSGAHATFDRATFDFSETESFHGALTPTTIARRALVMTNCGTVQIDPCSRTGLVRIHLTFDPAVIILGPADFREFIEEARPAWLAFSITWGPAALKWE
jgi:hypothetical protein